MSALRYDGPFTPPSERGSLILPANVGGAHWGGVSYDPTRQIVVVPTNRIAAVITLIPRAAFQAPSGEKDRHERIGTEYAGMHGTPYVLKRETFLGPSNVPCTPPPFGALVGVSMETGRMLWTTPLGTVEGLERFGMKAPPGVRGMFNLGGAITTAAGLTFIAASPDAYIRAFDTRTGRGSGRQASGRRKGDPDDLSRSRRTPVSGIAAGGDGQLFGRADEIVAFALPSP